MDNEINFFFFKKNLFDKCENRRLRGFWGKKKRLELKKKYIYIMKKIFGTEPKIGYCPLSMRLGAGAQASMQGAGLGAGRWARGHAWARALQAVGRAGARRSGRVRACAGVSGRARTGAGARTVCMRRRARGRRQRRAGAGAAGTGARRRATGRAGARQGEGARGWASGRAAGRAGARLGERARGWASGRAAGRTVRAGHGRQAARARSLCTQAGPVGCSCTRLGFQLGFSTRYFF